MLSALLICNNEKKLKRVIFWYSKLDGVKSNNEKKLKLFIFIIGENSPIGNNEKKLKLDSKSLMAGFLFCNNEKKLKHLIERMIVLAVAM